MRTAPSRITNMVEDFVMAVPMLRVKLLPGYEVMMIDGEDLSVYYVIPVNRTVFLILNFPRSSSLGDEAMASYIRVLYSQLGLSERRKDDEVTTTIQKRQVKGLEGISLRERYRRRHERAD